MKHIRSIIGGKDDCDHDWLDAPTLDCLPPIYSHVCQKCGRSESWRYDEEEVIIDMKKVYKRQA